MKPAVLFVVGPTASGKSSVALKLAQKLNGEIISADSMQVYRGMNIGTAKPSLVERKAVKHHLINILKPEDSFSAFDFQRLALQKIKQIERKKKMVIVAGGTGLYVRALIHGLSTNPSADFDLREKWQKKAREFGPEYVYQYLKNISPEKAKEIHPNNLKRVIRAIEILEKDPAVNPFDGKGEGLTNMGYKCILIGIRRDREVLYDRINQRVDHMFERGLIQEVKKLNRKKISQTARQALGYKEIFAMLEGAMDSTQVKNLIKQSTRRFAKRQLTWFKKEEGIMWFDWKESESLDAFCRKLLLALRPKMLDFLPYSS